MKLPDDPQLLAPWAPTATNAWDRPAAAHLFRRASFSGTPAEIDAALSGDVSAAVDALIRAQPDRETKAVRALAAPIVAASNPDALGAWWLRVLCDTSEPLREKCAFLWQGHFAVSAVKVESLPLLYGHYENCHRLGLGDLRALVRAMVRDPALLIYLDADDNRKERPNENLARELFELFLLGIGNYTELDVREAARALTGLTHKAGKPRFIAARHDAGLKTILGHTAAFGADELIAHCFSRPGLARFLAQRLLRSFVHPDVPPRVLAAAADTLVSVDFNVAEFLRRILCSRLFFHPACRRALVKSPVEYVIGVLRQFALTVDSNELQRVIAAMGQRLFYPPSVQGWPLGERWISASRLIARLRFAGQVAALARGAARAAFVSELFAAQPDAAQATQAFTAFVVDGDLPPQLTEQLVRLADDPEGVIELVLGLPEMQLA
ncbi:MAG: DUF1800 family protein [Planctomycetota bacterium]